MCSIYCKDYNSLDMNNEELEGLSDMIREKLMERILKSYNMTTEINGNGTLIKRAVAKQFPYEVIDGELRVYQHFLN